MHGKVLNGGGIHEVNLNKFRYFVRCCYPRSIVIDVYKRLVCIYTAHTKFNLI